MGYENLTQPKKEKCISISDLTGTSIHFGFGIFSQSDYENNYMIDEFCLEPGQVTRIIGSGFSGKTNAMIDLLLAAATDGKWLNKFQVKMPKNKKAMFVAFEGSEKRLMKRVNRIGTARGIKFDDIFDRLVLNHKPGFRLSDPNQYENYVNVLSMGWKEFGLIIIDNQRTLAPSIKENDSDSRWILDVLSDVSERTGAVIIVLHHTGKDEARERGSSGYWDATGCQWLLKGRGRAPKVMEQVKSVEELYFEPIGIEFKDVGEIDPVLKKERGLSILAVNGNNTEVFESDQISKALEIHIKENINSGKTDIIKAVAAKVSKKETTVRNLLDIEIGANKYQITKIGRTETLSLKPIHYGETSFTEAAE